MNKNSRGFSLIELVQVFFLLALVAGAIAVLYMIVHFIAKFW